MPLSGIRVVEIGDIPAGAYCARVFADFGADVLKLEAPEGARTRFRAPVLDIGNGQAEGCYFGFLNGNKRSAIVDSGSAADRRQLQDLLSGADVLIDSLSADQRRLYGIDHAALRECNPDLVILSASWFGEDGPYRDFQGTDAVCRALAGLIYLVGPEDGAPTPLPDYQADIVAGLTAFIPAMAALLARPRGRRFEVNVFESNICIADYNIALDWAAQRRDRRWGKNRFWPNYPLGIFRCKEGWIGVTIVTPVQWTAFCELLGLQDLIGDPRYAVNRDRIKVADELQARFEPVFLQRTAQEWFEIALEHRLPFVVVPDMADLLADAEHRRRSAFVPVRHGDKSYEMPASPHRLTRSPPRQGGRIPALGETTMTWAQARVAPPAKSTAGDKPLAGIRVADLSMGWAGPHATRHLADLGADVIKVEACQYPDWWRGVDNRPIVIEQRLYEKSSYFNVMNRNKRGVTLDLTTDEGVALVKELVKHADVVVENYSAGVLKKLKLDYDELSKVNPRIIMVGMPAFAADGPLREARAYGSTLEQASGVPSIARMPGGRPGMNHIAYGDPIGGMNAAVAILVALQHRERTGEGQRIDLSQVECMLPMVGPWIIEQSATGQLASHMGHRHPAYVPYGCFPCSGDDSWVFVAVEDDVQWASLCKAMERPDLACSQELFDLQGRRRREDDVEEALRAWTIGRTAESAMLALQRAGIPAGIVRSPVDLLGDPHLKARNFWQVLDRSFTGPQPNPSPAYRETSAPYPIARPAPTLGEHNDVVLKDLLGLSDSDLVRLTEIGIIGTEAVPPNMRKARAAVGRAASSGSAVGGV